MTVSIEVGINLIFTGKAASGKTIQAQETADRFGTYKSISASVWRNKYHRGSILITEPDTLIIDGIDLTAEEVGEFKCIASNERMTISRMWKNDIEVKAPNIILCCDLATIRNTPKLGRFFKVIWLK